MATISYGPNAYRLPAWAEQRVSAYLDACGIPSAEVTSTFRPAEDQARVMVEQYGTPEGAAALYNGPKGKAVLAAWAANRTNPIPAMAQAMTDVGFMSAHMNPNLATLDIAPSSVGPASVGTLVAYAKGRMAFGEVKEVFGPGDSDAAIHMALIPPTNVVGRIWNILKVAAGGDDNTDLQSDVEDSSSVAEGGGVNLVALGVGAGFLAWLFWG